MSTHVKQNQKIEPDRIAKGTSVQRAGSPRVRHGLAKLLNGMTRADCFGGANRVAGAALWAPEVQISWQAQHLVPMGIKFVTGA